MAAVIKSRPCKKNFVVVVVVVVKLEDKLREKVTMTCIQGVNLKQESKQAEINAKKINLIGEKEIFSK